MAFSHHRSADMSDEPDHHAVSQATCYVLAAPGDTRVARSMAAWLAAAKDAASADTQLFAKLIAEREARNELALLGVASSMWHALMQRHFSNAQAWTPAHLLIDDDRANFVDTLHAVLMQHASSAVDTNDARCLATIVTHACLRPDHLWRDLGLAGRDEVTWMLTRYFPTLVALNTGNLRWKKFLAQQRAFSLGIEPGPAPGCPGCEDYRVCFPERA
jgi:nitrogen fixation protein NifQ